MLKTVRAVVEAGQIRLLEPVALTDGTELLVTMLEDENGFWSRVSELSLNAVWDNPDDDVYAELLER